MKSNKSVVQAIFFAWAATLFFLAGCKKEEATMASKTNGRTTAEFNPDLQYGTMTDQQGNIYKTIKIGDMVWMAENLRTTIFNDGIEITNITDDDEWANRRSPAYCTYNNTNNPDSIATYGCLYNWFAVGTGKLAPEGWHVATDEEWWALIKLYGDRPVSGGCLKETGSHHWIDPNNGASNSSGFTALPSGSRFENGRFMAKGSAFRCWRSEKYLEDYGICWYVSYINIFSAWAFHLQQTGFSVRCVKD